MRRRGWAVAVLTTLALLLARGAAADQSYTDPAGDATSGAPDITTVAVANDGAGKITIDVAFAALPGSGSFFGVSMDTDNNLNTGDYGADYSFFLPSSGDGWLERWDGSDFVPIASPTVRVSFANGVVHFEANRNDLGNTSGLTFLVLALRVSDQGIGEDWAPNDGFYQYTLAQHAACADKIDNDNDDKIDAADPGCSGTTDTDETDPPPPPPPLKLTAGKPAALAGSPKAGAAFMVSMTVTRSDGKVFTGTVTCTAKAGAATIRAAGRAVAGTARCTMRLPKAAKGKRLSGSITATSGTAKVAKPYAFAIR